MNQLLQINAEIAQLDRLITAQREQRNRLAVQRYALHVLEIFRALPELATLGLTASMSHEYDDTGTFSRSWAITVQPTLSALPAQIEVLGERVQFDTDADIEYAECELAQILESSWLYEHVSDLGDNCTDRTFKFERSALTPYLDLQTVDALRLLCWFL